MLTISDFTWYSTLIRLHNGVETIAVKERTFRSVQEYLELARLSTIEERWLTGELTDEEAIDLGLSPDWLLNLRSNLNYHMEQEPIIRYLTTIQPGDILIETTSSEYPIVKLTDIVAICHLRYLQKEKWIAVEMLNHREEDNAPKTA